MTEAHDNPSFPQQLLELCNRHESAVSLIMNFWHLCGVWDDAIDRDKYQGDDAVNEAFMWALFGLHSNEFYRRHEPALRCAMQSCIAEWQTANRLERTKRREALHTSYTLRCSPFSFFTAVVLLAGGHANAQLAAQLFRTMGDDDTLESYLNEHLAKD